MVKKHVKDTDHGAATLVTVSSSEIPLREVSGLAIATLGGTPRLVAVGDRGPNVAIAELPSGTSVGPWSVIDLSELDTPSGAPRVRQAEAIAHDGVRTAVVLIEDPPLLLVLDTHDRRLSAAVTLDASGTGVDAAWRDDAASRGEGIVLMRDGHALIVKEKRPAGLLEFGPAGDQPFGISRHSLHRHGEQWSPPSVGSLAALAWWPAPTRLRDLSDAAVGPDGALFLLSDQDNAIARLELPLMPGETMTYGHIWRLPDAVEKAEGLAILPDGTVLVAVDRADTGRNLATFGSLP